jgi:hypothetical protein
MKTKFVTKAILGVKSVTLHRKKGLNQRPQLSLSGGKDSKLNSK